MKIQHVPLEWVPRTWPLVAEHIAAAVEHAKGDYDVSHLQAMVASGQAVLVVAVEEGSIVGAGIIEIFNRPTARVAFIMAMGGKFIVTEDSLTQLKALLAAMGVTAIEGAARESVFRLLTRLGFTEKYRIFEVKL